MDRIGELFTLWFFVFLFTVFPGLALWRREFTYRGGKTIRATERPVHYWTMAFVMLLACVACWAIAISRTWPN